MCFYVHIFWYSHASMFIFFDFYVHMLWWSYTHMSTCFDENKSICIYALILICSNAFMIGCSYVNKLHWSHAFKFTCHDDKVILCVHALMITCPLAVMPLSSYAWTLWLLPNPILKCFDDRMSHALIFTWLISAHRFTHLDDEMSISSKAKVIVGRVYAQMRWRLYLNAEMIWEIRGMCTWVLKYSYASMLSWSRACMFTCLVDNLQSFDFPLMIKCSYVYLLKWSLAPMFMFFDDHMPFTCMPSFSYDWMLWWLLAHMFKCLIDCMLTCVDIHMFDIHTQVHTR